MFSIVMQLAIPDGHRHCFKAKYELFFNVYRNKFDFEAYAVSCVMQHVQCNVMPQI